MTTCKTCVHAKWEMTPAGNIRTSIAGRCVAGKKLTDEFLAVATRYPGVLIVSALSGGIWTNTDASNCPGYEVKPS